MESTATGPGSASANTESPPAAAGPSHGSREQLEAELTDTKLLQELSAELIHQANVSALYDKIMDAAVAIMRSQCASMQLLHPERRSGGELRLLCYRGFNQKAAEFWQWVRADSESTCGVALRTGARVVVADVEECAFMAGTENLATYRLTGIRAVQSTPLISRGGQILGMISTHWREPYEPSERRLRLLDLLVRQAADLTERGQAEEALRHRAAQYETLFNQSPLGVYLVDAEFRIREVNPVALPAFGAIPGLIGRDFGDVMHILWEPKYADEVVRICRETLTTGKPYVAAERAEFRIDRNITEYHEWRLDRIPLPDGRFGAVCHFRDIASEVQARRTQQLLAEELNHRVKNTLASVQAIAQHTLRGSKDPASFASSFAGRIQSMARAHSMLTGAAWQGADLRDVIRDQVQLGPVDESRLTAWGPAIRMQPQMVQHVALMLHELGANSAKYGALSAEKGWVTINWIVEDGLLRLKWIEQGGPLVSAPITRGFGTILIEQSARSQGGNARMSIDATGISWEITFPLPPNVSIPETPASSELVELGVLQQVLADRPPARLAGRRFLIVEDEPLVSLDLVAGLQEAGAEIVGPAGTSEEALQLIDRSSMDAALLDGNLRGRPVDDVAAALTRRGIPFVFVTGYGRESLPRAFGNAAVLAKPFSLHQLLEAATRLVGPLEGAARLREK